MRSVVYLSTQERVYQAPIGSGPSVLTLQGPERDLTRQIDLSGKSGASYRYSVLTEAEHLPPAGANYVIAATSPTGTQVLFVGETENLSRAAWREDLARAEALYGPASLLTRLNVRSDIRLAEQGDLIAQHSPPMNGPPVL